jgi:hypothetical protein
LNNIIYLVFDFFAAIGVDSDATGATDGVPATVVADAVAVVDADAALY